MAGNNTTTLIFLNEIAGYRELSKAIKAFCDAVIKGRAQIVPEDEADFTRSKYAAETYLSQIASKADDALREPTVTELVISFKL